MRNVSSKKGWMIGMIQPHLDLPRILIIKEEHNGKSDKNSVKLELHIDQKISTSDPYEFKMTLFGSGNPEEFLLFIHNFNMTLQASWMLDADAKF